jgi:subtilisin family serine protease
LAQPLTPNDPLWEFQWNLRKIGAPEAWVTAKGGGSVVVVIDTGVDYTHEDLGPNMWRNPGETGLDDSGHDKASNHIDDDANGYVDDVYGIDVVSGDSDPMDEGFIVAGVPVTTYHGTSCAGIIGAGSDNGKGIAGLNWNVSIIAIRALWYDVDREFNQAAYDAHLLEAYRYVLKLKRAGVNIRATSNSYGSASYSSALREAIEDLGKEGILNVFSAGNNYLDNDDLTFYPAGYNLASILSVAQRREIPDPRWADGAQRLGRGV